MSFKKKMVNNFSKCLLTEHDRKNAVTSKDITTTLYTAANRKSFVNEACQNSGRLVKSQIMYRKLEENKIEDVQMGFRKQTVSFLKQLDGRKFIISYDITEEAYYGEFNKENNLYLHDLTYDQKGAQYCYKYLTVAITSNGNRYILDGIIVHRGMNIEDYVYKMTKFIKKYLSIEVVLFDRGFGWGIIHMMQGLKVNYMVFWKKQGSWYKRYFEEMDEGEFSKIQRDYKYNRDFTNHKVKSNFILINQLEYEGKKLDWIFATNLDKSHSKKYVMIYKKRWGIETIYRVTEDVRIYTTSTSPLIRYFLFMFSCLFYNIWKFFQMFLGGEFTLSNFKINMIIYLFETGGIYPDYYGSFLEIVSNYFEF